VNRQIRNLAVSAVVLLAALVVGATYWQAWAVGDLAAKQDNAIQLVAQFEIKRGLVYAGDGKTLLAANRAQTVKGQTFYFRRYPTGPLFSDVVGYSTESRFRTGLERSLNDYLTASNSHLSTVLSRTLDRLEGKTVTGNNLVLTLRPGAQWIAQKALDGNCGAAVALDPRTGKVLVMATSPSYNPNLVERNFNLIEKQAHANCSPPAPLVNRATDGLFTPGSSFKILTASAAIDTGTFTPDSSFYDPGYCIEYGKQVHNFADQSGPERFGNVTLATALQHSINAVFCEVGKRLGAITILDYAKRFGFYKLPPLETPSSERQASGLYNCDRRTGRCSLFFPKHDYQVDPGRLAFGQERMSVTPLQMAMVAGAIGNHGVEMQPYLVDRIVAPGGGVVTRTKPRVLARPIKPKTAQEVTAMMESVVTGGTGTAAQIPGVAVAGKTGTAETGVGNRNTTWFVAFAPAQAPRVAVAVVLENQTSVGGLTAAPVAKTIMQALLSVGRRSTH
jgi:peptidoglycan glycosyltransferase